MTVQGSDPALSLDAASRTLGHRDGPFAFLLCETDALAQETFNHLNGNGFQTIIAMGPGAVAIQSGTDNLVRIEAPILDPAERTRTLNRLIASSAGSWCLICFNGDFLYFPFSESRGVADLIEFQTSERRKAVMAYSIDLYSDSMIGGGAPALDEAYFDTEGWYGFERGDRQVDVYGGLGWRYEEYMPVALSRINRPALFLAQPDVTITEALWFTDKEMNTVSCPWHNNPTIALMSFRRARTLMAHPKFSGGVSALRWRHSAKFAWRSDQLVENGLIEAGQWM